MNLSNIKLSNYRNYNNLELEIPSGLIVLHGDNAQGKTNLLEAIYLLSISKAYRARSDREVINKYGDGTFTQVLGVANTVEDVLRVMVNIHTNEPYQRDANSPYRIRKDIRVNGVPKVASDLVGTLKAVLFDPEDIKIVTGSPALRRRYIDILISQLDRRYLKSLQKYQKILYQRNHLIRSIRDKKSNLSEMDFWDEQLITEGSFIIEKRYEIVAKLFSTSKEMHSRLTDDRELLQINYVPSFHVDGYTYNEITSRFMKALEKNRNKEIAYGISSTGPHRDDLSITIGGLAASLYASRGQSRTIALVLKLSEGTILQNESGMAPLLLLDDILSELDDARTDQLLKHITASEQALLTTSDLGRITPHHLSKSTTYSVKAGTVTRN